MAKRFIDTELFDDEWFMDLSKEAKIIWIYFITKCNHAGFVQINPKLIVLQTGIKSYETVIQELGNRCVRVKEHLYFIPKFIIFQYPGFPNSKVKAQISVVSELERYGFFVDGKVTVPKDLPNSFVGDTEGYGYENGYGYIYPSKIQKNHLFKEDEFSDFEKFKLQFEDTEFADADLKYYFDSFMDWSNSKGEKKVDWIATVRNGMRKDKKENRYKQIVKQTRTNGDHTANELKPNPDFKDPVYGN